MRKQNIWLMLAAITLAVGGCAGNSSYSSPSSSLEELDARAKTRPDNISDNEIAWFLSAGLPRFPFDVSRQPKQADKDVGVLMWRGPMRVSVEDGEGNDLDLSTYPGSVIRLYLISLADYTKLPITITHAARHDNNASIVVSKSRTIGDAGTIYGVPELSDRPRQNISGILSTSYIPRYDEGGPEEDTSGSFMLGYGAKACAEHLVIPESSSSDPQYVWERINSFMHMCLGPAGILFFLGETGEPRVMFEEQKHPWYFWKVLYNSRLHPGMRPREAKSRVLEYLNAEQSH